MKEELSPEVREQMKAAAREHMAQSSIDSELPPEIREQMKASILNGKKNNSVKIGGFDPSEWFRQSIQDVKDAPQNIRELPGHTKNIAQGGLAGVAKTGFGAEVLAAKGMHKLANALGLKLPPLEESEGYQEALKSMKGLYPEGLSSKPEGKIAYEAGKIAPTALLPTGKGKLIAQVLKNAGMSEALSPVFNPEKSIPESLQEGILPSLGAGATAAAFKIPGGIVKLMSMGGKASPEEFEANVRAVGDKPVGIGTLSKSPFLGWLEKVGLPNVLGAGQAQKNIQVGEMLDKDVGNVLKDLNIVPSEKPRYRASGTNPEEYEAVPTTTQTQKVSENLQQNFQKNEQIKRNLYSKRDEIAKKLGAKVNPENLKNAAVEEFKILQDELNRGGTTNVSPEAMKDIKAAALNAFTKNGKKIDQSIPFERINFKKGEYAEKADIARKAGKRNEARIYEKLQKGLESDFRNASKELNNSELNAAQNAADQHFKEKIAPILNNESLYAHAIGDANPDMIIRDFISSGKYDSPEQVSGILKNLDKEHRKQFSHEFLTRGLKDIDSKEEALSGNISDSVLNTYKNLGNETKRLMFSPAHKKTLDRALKTRKLMDSSIDQMANPKTGYSNARAAALGLQGLLAGAGGHAASLMGMPPVESYLAGLAGTGYGGRALSNYLTSPLARSVYKGSQNLKNLSGKPPINPAALTALLYGENQK